MAMLAKRKQRNRYTLVPRGKALYEDENRFGTKILEKMGWKKGQGIGANNHGSKDFVRVKYKNDNLGFGFESRDDQWTQHEQIFNGLLKVLNKGDDVGDFNMQKDNNCEDDIQQRFGFGFQGSTEVAKPNQEKINAGLSGISLEERSKQSKVRVHYKKFTKGKDLTQYSEKDLANIFGKKSANDLFQHLNNSLTNDQQNLKYLQINTGITINEYFKAKMEALKKQNRCNGINVGENFAYEAQIEEHNPKEAEYAEKTKEEEEEENKIKHRKVLENNEQLDFLKKEKVTKKKRKNVEDINLDKTSLGEPMEKILKQNTHKTGLDYCVEKVNEKESKYLKQRQKFKELDELETMKITEEPLKEKQKETNIRITNEITEITDNNIVLANNSNNNFARSHKIKFKKCKESILASSNDNNFSNISKPENNYNCGEENFTKFEEKDESCNYSRKKRSKKREESTQASEKKENLYNFNKPEKICEHSLEKLAIIEGNELSSKSLRKKKGKRNKDSIETSVFKDHMPNINKPDETCSHSLEKLAIIEGNDVNPKSFQKKKSKNTKDGIEIPVSEDRLSNINVAEDICDHSLEKFTKIEGNELNPKSLRNKKSKRNKDSIETSVFEDHLSNLKKPDETCNLSLEKFKIIQGNNVSPNSPNKKKSKKLIETSAKEENLSNLGKSDQVFDHSLEKLAIIEGNDINSKSIRKEKSKRNKGDIETSMIEDRLPNCNKSDDISDHSLEKFTKIEGNEVCPKSPRKKKSKKSIEPSAIEENLSNLSTPNLIEGNDVNPDTFRKENSEKLNDSIETSGSEDNLSSLKKPEEKLLKAKRKNLSPNAKRPLINDANLKELSLEEMKEKCKAFNIYPISSFCAEKFRNLNVNDFNGSSLAVIEGYSLGPDLQLDVKFKENDEERIICLWKGVLNKYVQSGKPKRAYRQYIKKTIEARRENQKRPKLSIKTWKRKNAFQII